MHPTPRTNRLRAALEELKDIGPEKSLELTRKFEDIEILRAKLDAEYDEAMCNLASFLCAEGSPWAGPQFSESSLAKEPRLMHECRKQMSNPRCDKIYHWQTPHHLYIQHGGLWICLDTVGLGQRFDAPPVKDQADTAARKFIEDHRIRHERTDIRCRLLQAYLDGRTESSPKAANP